MKDEVKEQLISYLLKISDGRWTLTPAQLEKIIHISPKQQSILRKKQIFPIPYDTIGRLVHYPIKGIVAYLLDGTVTEMEDKPQKEEIKIRTANKKPVNKSNTQNLSHIFNLRSFAGRLNDESKQLKDLSDSLEKIADITENYKKLSQDVNKVEYKDKET